MLHHCGIDQTREQPPPRRDALPPQLSSCGISGPLEKSGRSVGLGVEKDRARGNLVDKLAVETGVDGRGEGKPEDSICLSVRLLLCPLGGGYREAFVRDYLVAAPHQNLRGGDGRALNNLAPQRRVAGEAPDKGGARTGVPSRATRF